MKPIEFAEQNCVYAKDQPEYLPLPAFKTAFGPDNLGEVWSCWRPTMRERIKLLFTRKIWLSCATFGRPLQPVRLMVDSPFNPRSWKRIHKGE